MHLYVLAPQTRERLTRVSGDQQEHQELEARKGGGNWHEDGKGRCMEYVAVIQVRRTRTPYTQVQVAPNTKVSLALVLIRNV